MTTKKQRRAMVAERTAQRREAERKVNLELLRIAQEKRESKMYEAKRAATKRKAKTPIPENFLKSLEAVK